MRLCGGSAVTLGVSKLEDLDIGHFIPPCEGGQRNGENHGEKRQSHVRVYRNGASNVNMIEAGI